jgi:hypothetical protein
MTADRGAPRTELIAACDVVADDPSVSMALVVLPRRLRDRDLGPFAVVRQGHEAQLHRRLDGGLDLVVLDAAASVASAEAPSSSHSTRHAPAWVRHLMHLTESVR